MAADALAMRVVPLAQAGDDAVLEYLDRAPYENVFLTHVAGANAGLRRHVYVAVDDGHVAGVALMGDHVVLAAEDRALPALAAAARRLHERAIVGPRRTVDAYWELVRAWHRPPRLVRERQPLLAVDETTLREDDRVRVRVRNARDDEWRVVAAQSAEMIAGEIEAPSHGDGDDFAAGIRRMIHLRLWWVAERDGELCFFCNVGAWSERTAQLQGIWTPARFRGCGVATAALGRICRILLRVVPTLSLYVNEANAPARALYGSLGFQEVGELETIFF